MAVPTLISSITFAAQNVDNSQIWNQGQAAARRMISVTIPRLPEPAPYNLAGWVWGEVRNDLNTFVRFASLEVLIASETAIYLPAEFTGVVWRCTFYPVEKIGARTGTWRFYTI